MKQNRKDRGNTNHVLGYKTKEKQRGTLPHYHEVQREKKTPEKQHWSSQLTARPPEGKTTTTTITHPRSGPQSWLHTGITWGAFKKSTCA